jgi:F0F1-type ATP synthase epsilon subunit
MLRCIITSPEETKHYDLVQKVTLPAFFGKAQILPGHAEAFLLLKEGDVVIQSIEEQKKSIQINGGECYIDGSSVVVIL